ncbi:unnamed protein product [Phytomonas sp. Hart1]|nr:unnamed protein product [Phytomonas sp. Hart1]|eukprot:CCW71588.1 unnamed protein product [Phytomonas sp. isolate Hart1]
MQPMAWRALCWAGLRQRPLRTVVNNVRRLFTGEGPKTRRERKGSFAAALADLRDGLTSVTVEKLLGRDVSPAQKCLERYSLSQIGDKGSLSQALYRWLQAAVEVVEAAKMESEGTSLLSSGLISQVSIAAGVETSELKQENLSEETVKELEFELQEHEEYINMAQEELHAMDELLKEANTKPKGWIVCSEDVVGSFPRKEAKEFWSKISGFYNESRDGGAGEGETRCISTDTSQRILSMVEHFENARLLTNAEIGASTSVAFSNLVPQSSTGFDNTRGEGYVPLLFSGDVPDNSTTSANTFFKNIFECPVIETALSSEFPRLLEARDRTNGSGEQMKGFRDEEGCFVINSQETPGVLNSCKAPLSMGEALSNSHTNDAVLGLSERLRYEKRIDELEKELKQALNASPKDEIQLLKGDLKASNHELRRLTEERDRLMAERWGMPLTWEKYSTVHNLSSSHLITTKKAAEGGECDTNEGETSVGANKAEAPFTNFGTAVEEELKERLAIAYQRIRELEKANGVGLSSVRTPAHGMERLERRPIDLTEAGEGGLRRGHHSSADGLPGLPNPPEALQAQVKALQQHVEAHQRTTRGLEERLNRALHDHREAQRQILRHQKEQTTLWARLGEAEGKLLARAEAGECAGRGPSPRRVVGLLLEEEEDGPHPPTSGGLEEEESTVSVGVSEVGGSLLSSFSFRPRLEAPAGRSANLGTDSPESSFLRVMTTGGGSWEGPSRRHPLGKPLEGMSAMELRREVLRLRREVEALQSCEARLKMELESGRERQMEERLQRQRARNARLQVLQRLGDVVKQKLLENDRSVYLDNSDHSEEGLMRLLEKSKKEVELLVQRHQI